MEVSSFQCTAHAPLPVKSRSGALHCFNCLIEENQALLYNLALRMLGDPAAAEDATQETFVAAYRAFYTFRGDNPRPWLLRIASNVCRDMLHTRRARPSLSMEELALSSSFNPPSAQELPEEYALRRELGRVIQRGIGRLPYEQRLAVVLIDVQGLTYEEAAQAMDCSLGTVKSRLSRARAALRDILLQHRELLPGDLRQE